MKLRDIPAKPVKQFSDNRFFYRCPAFRHSPCVTCLCKKKIGFVRLVCVLCGVVFCYSFTHAQNIAINPTGAVANSSAGIDVDFTDKGVLLPRVALASTTDASTISSPATSLLVYNTATAGTSPTNVVPGYYYNAGTSGSPNWVYFQASNGTTNSTGHYIGELFGGGVIFYIGKDAGVEHGLIASLADLDGGAGVAWSGNTNTLIGATAQSSIDGQSNTTAIVAQNNTANKAATLCDSYSNAGFTDWYLPAIWELNNLYNVAFVINSVGRSEILIIGTIFCFLQIFISLL